MWKNLKLDYEIFRDLYKSAPFGVFDGTKRVVVQVSDEA